MDKKAKSYFKVVLSKVTDLFFGQKRNSQGVCLSQKDKKGDITQTPVGLIKKDDEYDYDPDYWDSPAYNAFWDGAPGLSPHTKKRPNYGPLQIRNPEEIEIGQKYRFEYFNGVRRLPSRTILIKGKDEMNFYYEVLSPPEEVTVFFNTPEKYRGKMTFASCSILPYETGRWNQDDCYLLRIAE